MPLKAGILSCNGLVPFARLSPLPFGAVAVDPIDPDAIGQRFESNMLVRVYRMRR